jgi:hypothetical protein
MEKFYSNARVVQVSDGENENVIVADKIPSSPDQAEQTSPLQTMRAASTSSPRLLHESHSVTAHVVKKKKSGPEGSLLSSASSTFCSATSPERILALTPSRPKKMEKYRNSSNLPPLREQRNLKQFNGILEVSHNSSCNTPASNSMGKGNFVYEKIEPRVPISF